MKSHLKSLILGCIALVSCNGGDPYLRSLTIPFETIAPADSVNLEELGIYDVRKHPIKDVYLDC